MGYRDTLSANPNSSNSDPLGASEDAISVLHQVAQQTGLVNMTASTMRHPVDCPLNSNIYAPIPITDGQGDNHYPIRIRTIRLRKSIH
jgi:hypothetical protein